jgi:hypothetical protein
MDLGLSIPSSLDARSFPLLCHFPLHIAQGSALTEQIASLQVEMAERQRAWDTRQAELCSQVIQLRWFCVGGKVTLCGWQAASKEGIAISARRRLSFSLHGWACNQACMPSDRAFTKPKHSSKLMGRLGPVWRCLLWAVLSTSSPISPRRTCCLC